MIADTLVFLKKLKLLHLGKDSEMRKYINHVVKNLMIYDVGMLYSWEGKTTGQSQPKGVFSELNPLIEAINGKSQLTTRRSNLAPPHDNKERKLRGYKNKEPVESRVATGTRHTAALE